MSCNTLCSTSVRAILESCLESLFAIEMRMSLISVQHGGLGEEDEVVPGLESESRRSLLAFGVDEILALDVSDDFSLFMMQSLLNHSSVYSSR